MSRYVLIASLVIVMTVVGLVASPRPGATSCTLINALVSTGTVSVDDFVTIGSASASNYTLCNNTFDTRYDNSSRRTSCTGFGVGTVVIRGHSLSGTYKVDTVTSGDSVFDCVELCACQ